MRELEREHYETQEINSSDPDVHGFLPSAKMVLVATLAYDIERSNARWQR